MTQSQALPRFKKFFLFVFVSFYLLLPLAIAIWPTETTFNLCIFATLVPLTLSILSADDANRKKEKDKVIFWDSVLLLAICCTLACVTLLLWNLALPPELVWVNQAAFPAIISLFFFYLYVIYRFINPENR